MFLAHHRYPVTAAADHCVAQYRYRPPPLFCRRYIPRSSISNLWPAGRPVIPPMPPLHPTTVIYHPPRPRPTTPRNTTDNPKTASKVIYPHRRCHRHTNTHTHTVRANVCVSHFVYLLFPYHRSTPSPMHPSPYHPIIHTRYSVPERTHVTPLAKATGTEPSLFYFVVSPFFRKTTIHIHTYIDMSVCVCVCLCKYK